MRKLARGLIYILAAIGALGVIGMLFADPESPPAAEAGPEPEPVATQQPATPEPEEEPESTRTGMPTCEEFRVTFAEPVQVFTDAGHIRFGPRSVYVHPLPWAAIDRFQKEAFSRNMLRWANCLYFPDTRTDAGTVFDLQSGREIASVGVLRGFRVK